MLDIQMVLTRFRVLSAFMHEAAPLKLMPQGCSRDALMKPLVDKFSMKLITSGLAANDREAQMDLNMAWQLLTPGKSVPEPAVA